MCQHAWIYVGSGIVECTTCKTRQSLWKTEREKFIYLYKLFLIGADISPYFQAA